MKTPKHAINLLGGNISSLTRHEYWNIYFLFQTQKHKKAKETKENRKTRNQRHGSSRLPLILGGGGGDLKISDQNNGGGPEQKI